MDLSAAFDTIEHSILLTILQQDFGVDGSALNWFDSFLSGRKQRILVGDKTSDDFNLNCGVPQGIADVRSWFIGNLLMINDGKTDFLIIDTRQQLEKTSIESIIIGDTVIKPSKSVRNLGSWFDAHMRMNVHIGKICSKAFRGLYNIRQIRKFLTVQSTKTLIHAFVSSHLDYCNALLFGLPKYQLDRL